MLNYKQTNWNMKDRRRGYKLEGRRKRSRSLPASNQSSSVVYSLWRSPTLLCSSLSKFSAIMRLLINDRPWILLCLSFWKFYWLPSAANGQDPQDGNNNNHRREKSLHHLPLVVSYRPIWPISNYGPIPMANYLPFYWHYSQHPATLTNIQRARQGKLF